MDSPTARATQADAPASPAPPAASALTSTLRAELGVALRRRHLWLFALALASVLSLALACASGAVTLSAARLWQGLSGHGDALAASLVDLRLTRALAGWLTGAALATAGVLMQVLIRNPLADPYVLGVSGGAAVGALLALLAGLTAWQTQAGALGGAAAVSLLLLLLARHDLRSGGESRGAAPLLLLTGVLLSSACAALVALMLAIAPDGRLRGMVFWMIGDLAGASPHPLAGLVLLAVMVWAVRQARALDRLAMHSEDAATQGVAIGPLRMGLFAGAAVLTAGAVATAGSIGFVGLIVPHACRFVLGPGHRFLLPAAALAGGAFLVLADTAARTLLAPVQLPVGVLTALIGVPVFLLQLHGVRRATR